MSRLSKRWVFLGSIQSVWAFVGVLYLIFRGS